MFLRRIYYQIKPVIPESIRVGIRRWQIKRQRDSFKGTWPINERAAASPKGWPGWPDQKQFAFVLAHDVEGNQGLQRCQQLAELESALGFRSCFYIIPEGRYQFPSHLSEYLAAHGFEVGVHDLRHDGKLFSSRAAFQAAVPRINHYIKEWKAYGFRSAFMFHNLAWQQDLKVHYNATTFDFDPFEPQPDGTNTIFPFWVPGRNLDHGFIELPYTLPQDSTLFIYLQEKSIETWKRKLDWIVARGGMAFLTVHPDYLALNGSPTGRKEYPEALFREFLEYVQSKYAGRYWNALPKEVATYAHRCRAIEGCSMERRSATITPAGKTTPPKKIWIDLDNTPHVPFFQPIIHELERRGYDLTITARDAFQVCELATAKGISFTKVGRHHGRNKLLKLVGLFYRALQLAPQIIKDRPQVALSHGSRSQFILCTCLRIPSIQIADYEFAKVIPCFGPRWEIVPEIIPDNALCCPPDRVRKYPGIKEDVYISQFKSDPQLLAELDLHPDDIVITVRPPANEAHYHNPESEKLFVQFMQRTCLLKGIKVVLLPRNKKQAEAVQKNWPHWFANRHTVIPKKAIDGLNLLWYSDLVVSGGGTMNREAAALGIPVYSVFRGKIGAVDRQLQKESRLILIENSEDVERKIVVARRNRNAATPSPVSPHQALSVIVRHIEEILGSDSSAD
jgi:uncharacterized protein